MLSHEFLEYIFEDFFVFEKNKLFENANWSVYQSKNFKKGFKKHRNDKRVRAGLEDILNAIQQHKQIPQVTEYPSQYNVHELHHREWKKKLWAHLKGQKIGLIFSVEPGKIYLYHLGTHQEAKIDT